MIIPIFLKLLTMQIVVLFIYAVISVEIFHNASDFSSTNPWE